MNRDQWAAARERLIATDERNGRCLEIVETALFALCLDDTSPSDTEELARHMLHGDGRNRWFDKSLQLIVCRNGKAALNGEHSGHDATTSLRLVADIQADQLQADDGAVPDPVTGKANPAQLLEFLLDESLHATLRTAAETFDQLVADTTIGVLDFEDFGKNGITGLNIGPDTFVQLAVQAAQRRLFGFNYSTYESVMTRQFLHGRTEAMRSVTPEVVHFAETLAAEHGDDARDDLAEALRAAETAHRERVKTCRAGHGVERHLLGLLKTYESFGAELGMPEQPDLFTSPGWLALRHDTLSTSNGSSDAVDLFCFGPSVDDGLGVAYVIQQNRINFAVTSRSTMRQANKDFLGYLEESLLAMADVLS
jgi:carnitine O-acetyltransferase